MQELREWENATVLTYDGGNRLQRVTAADGKWLQFTYGDAANYYKITKVEDNFGRKTILAYLDDPLAGVPRTFLTGITDMAGMTSTFTESGLTGDSSRVINQMITPYGTTSFQSSYVDYNRWIEVTDPMGGKERYEYRGMNDEIASTDPTAPAGVDNSRLQHDNTCRWSKRAMMEIGSGPLDYSKAYITHWLK